MPLRLWNALWLRSRPLEQSSVRSRLAKTIRYVISQQLIPRKSGGRVAVLEVFKNTPRTAHYLDCEDPAGANLLDAIRNSTSEGTRSFDQEIEKLVRAGVVDSEVGIELRHRSAAIAALPEPVRPGHGFSRIHTDKPKHYDKIKNKGLIREDQ